MTNAQRQELHEDFMREGGVAITKAELRAAMDALDDWFDTNAATLNNTLPAAAKAGLTVKQKARLLKAVITKRYLVDA